MDYQYKFMYIMEFIIYQSCTQWHDRRSLVFLKKKKKKKKKNKGKNSNDNMQHPYFTQQYALCM